jgi:hypothetical protein
MILGGVTVLYSRALGFPRELVSEHYNAIRVRPPSTSVHQLWSQEYSTGNYVDPDNRVLLFQFVMVHLMYHLCCKSVHLMIMDLIIQNYCNHHYAVFFQFSCYWNFVGPNIVNTLFSYFLRFSYREVKFFAWKLEAKLFFVYILILLTGLYCCILYSYFSTESSCCDWVW